MAATFFASLLYLPQFMEKHLGYSPLEAGVGMLPFLAVFAVVSFVAGPLYNRLGAKPLAVARRAPASPSARSSSPYVDDGSGYGALVPGDGHARDRDRQLLPDRDDRRGHLGRRIADQPRRRHRLHVPDRRRLDRAGADDDRLLRLDPALRRRHPGRLPARRRALPGRPADRRRLRRRQRCSGRARRQPAPPSSAASGTSSFFPAPPTSLSLSGPPRSWSSPRPPTEAVGPRAAEQPVVAAAAVEVVVAGPADQLVGGAAAVRAVVARAAADRHRDRDVALR